MGASYERDGYAVLRRAVAPEAVDTALRFLHLSIRRLGLTAGEIEQCQQATFFPHLRWEPEVWGVLPPDAAEALGWQQGDDWADPQILLRFPDEEQDWPLRPHVDSPPPWAAERGYTGYRGVAGVALTTAGERDGCVVVWPGSHLSDADAGAAGEPRPVPLQAGDALLMHPRLAHAGSLNLGCSLRAAIYFRLLAGSPVLPPRAARQTPDGAVRPPWRKSAGSSMTTSVHPG